MQKLIEAIKDADPIEIDSTWALLKYKNLGILRKLKCLALIYCLEEAEIIESAPKDSNGRILDKETRTAIHSTLLEVSQQKNKQ